MTKRGTEGLKAKDFATDQDVRWCPGCGDYSILKQVQNVFAGLGINSDEVAIISGIGCAARFPYYMETYGIHSIHGRAPAIAAGLKMAKPELDVWVITGDGDALSIGGNHLIHCLRRNFDLNILLFNNQIYGLTKGQYSPTSEQEKLTKSSPYGSIDHPVNPLALAMGSDATFVARSMDRDPKHLQAMIRRAREHRGTSFLEVYQNCNIFNDGAFAAFTDKEKRDDNAIFLEHGQPLRFGKSRDKGVIIEGWKPKLVRLNEDRYSDGDLWIHDEKDIFKAQMLVRFFEDPRASEQALPRPFGVIYSADRPCYEELLTDQIATVQEEKGSGDLTKLLTGNTAWEI